MHSRVVAFLLVSLASFSFTPSFAQAPGTLPGRLAAPHGLAASPVLAHSRPAATANTSEPQAAAPVFSVQPGSYSGPQSVTVTDSTPGATIYYTTNGTYPTTSSAVYSTSITVSHSEILVAVAYATNYSPSPYASAEYYIGSSSDRFIYTVAGIDTWGYSGDGGLAIDAQINAPWGTAVDAQGNLYIADFTANVIRKVDGATGIISTIAGTGTASDTGDGGPATSATLWNPENLASIVSETSTSAKPAIGSFASST